MSRKAAQKITADSIQANGIVGAGGAGFPSHVKLKGKAEYFILNAAECEPLLHKDKELLLHYGDEVLAGMQAASEMLGGAKCVIGVKEKYTHVIEVLQKKLPSGFEIKPLRDAYPAGDEFVLVYDVTRRVIQPGGLPLHVGCVVNNVETVLNYARNAPVTRKFLTVTGAVKNPVTIQVPIGITIRECIEAAGGPTIDKWVVLLGGVMMGKLGDDLEAPITKTSGGIYVLPHDHVLAKRHRIDYCKTNRVGKSACDQCGFCTEMCPRYLLGHPIQPHKDMRALIFHTHRDALIVGSPYCCECNLCSMIACPEDLDPKNRCVQDKKIVREAGLKWTPRTVEAHPMNAARRTPTKRLITKLGLLQFQNKGPLQETLVTTSRVLLPLRQHVGAPSVATVKPGDKVREGDLVAAVPEGQLGARIHASISGTVIAVDDAVEIRA